MRKKALPYEDYVGQVFNRFTVTGFHIRTTPSGKWPVMECKCECGNKRDVLLSSLKGGKVKSCGCYARDNYGKQNIKHGMTNSREYSTWGSMKQRCYYPKSISYPNYGGRGITVCDRWLNSFEAFVQDMGPRPKGCSIERIDPNGNYEPYNCRWASALEQADNTRATNHVIYRGERINISEAARRAGLRQGSIRDRLAKGWTVEQAIETPQDKTQGARTKSNNRHVEYRGKSMILREACQLACVDDSHARYYLAKGMTMDQAVDTIKARRKANK